LFYEEKIHANGELDHATLPDAITEVKIIEIEMITTSCV
jgi:hypothetical protein